MPILSNYFLMGPVPLNAIHGHYDYRLVFLSFVIAVFTSYVAFDLIGSLRIESNKTFKTIWLIGGSIVMGSGIWSMHFIGMLAFTMPVIFTYNVFFTFISLLAAIFGSTMAFFVLRQLGTSRNALIGGGFLLGVSIVIMHYLGMAAMQGPDMPELLYLPSMFLLSILIAILASEAAIWLALKSSRATFVTQIRIKIVSAIIMGAAICGMHYTGMAAAVFLPTTHLINSVPNELNNESLALYIALMSGLIISVSLIISAQRQQIIHQIQKNNTFIELHKLQMSRDVLERYAENKTQMLEDKNIELLNAIEKLETAQMNLIHTEKMSVIGQLTAGIAHEVNNPLSFVISNVALINNYCAPIKKSLELTNKVIEEVKNDEIKTAKKHAGELEQYINSVNLNNKVNDLKTMLDESSEGLERIKNIIINLVYFASKNQITKEKINVNECIETAINLVWNQLRYKCNLHKNLVPLPQIMASNKQLEYVLVNLLLNAGHAIVDKGDIWISTKNDGKSIFIIIRDNGCGIEPENINKLFTPFYTTRPIGHGTGLGLATSCGIVQSHGGTIEVQSQVSIGSTFTIKLPLENRL